MRTSKKSIALAATLAIAAAILFVRPPAARAQTCVGDCNGDRQVTISELIRGVGIALGRQPLSSCPAFDPNNNQLVSINELIAGVNAALRGCGSGLTFRGLCLRPGTSGLVPCAAGTAVRLSRCSDRSRCLFDPTARTLLQSAQVGGDGRYAFNVDGSGLGNALLLLEADIEGGVVYRTVFFGPAGGTPDDSEVDPRSEAATRVLGDTGLDLFSDLSVRELILLIRQALMGFDFSGLSPAGAADSATDAARDNTDVQSAIDTRRFTPTPTRTPTLTSTITPTGTSTPTRTQSATPSSTHTVTHTSTVTPTRTPTSTPSSTPSITATPTQTRTPTATLPPLNLAIEVNPDPVRPGEAIEVRLVVTNTGGSVLNPVDISTVLPQNIEPFSDGSLRGAVSAITGTPAPRCGLNQINTCQPGGTLTWRVFSLQAGDAAAVSYVAVVSSGTAPGTELALNGTAVSGGLMQSVSHTAVVRSGTSNPFDLTLTRRTGLALPGELLTYDIAFGFRAVVGTAAPIVRVEPPAGTSFVSASDGGAPEDDGSVEWEIDPLDPGDGGRRRLTVMVDSDQPAGGLLEARAIIRRGDGSGDKRAHAVDWVSQDKPLRIAIEAQPDPARQNESFEVALTVTNSGVTAVPVIIDFLVPDLVENITDITTIGGGTCGAATLGNTCARRGRIDWVLTVPPRDGVTVRVDPVVSGGVVNGSLINLQARVVRINNNLNQYDQAETAVRVDSTSLWDLSLDGDRDPVANAEDLTYRVVARLRPTPQAQPVDGVIELALPDEVNFVSATADGEIDGDVVKWELGMLEPGAVVEREVTVRVDEAEPLLMFAEAKVYDAGDPLEAKQATEGTRIAIGSPLHLSTVVHQDPVRPGEVLETEFTVSNSSTSFFSTRIEARLPDGLDSFAQALSQNAACSATTLQCAPRSVVRWNPGIVPAASSTAVRMPPAVGAGVEDGRLIRLHVYAYTETGAVNGRNASMSRTVVVDSGTPFDLALTDGNDPVPAAQMFDYTIDFGRVAASEASDAMLRLELPRGVYLIGASNGGTGVGEDLVEWELGAIGSGETGRRTATVIVDELPAGTPLRARAAIVDETGADSEKRSYAATSVNAEPLVVESSMSAQTVAPGGVFTVTFTITNTGPTAVNNTIFEGIVPPEVLAFNDNTTTGGGRCGAFSFNACNPRDRVIFPIPTIGAGQTVTLTMTPTVRANIKPGTVVRTVGWFRESGNTGSVLTAASIRVE